MLFLGVLLFHVDAASRDQRFHPRLRSADALRDTFGTEAGGTRRVLTAAAFTYIAAALTAVLTFLYLLAVSRQ